MRGGGGRRRRRVNVRNEQAAEVEKSASQTSSARRSRLASLVVLVSVEVVNPIHDKLISTKIEREAGEGKKGNAPRRNRTPPPGISRLIPPLTQPALLLLRPLLQPLLQRLDQRTLDELLDGLFGRLPRGERSGGRARDGGDVVGFDRGEVPRCGLFDRWDGEMRESRFKPVCRGVGTPSARLSRCRVPTRVDRLAGEEGKERTGLACTSGGV